MCQLLIAVQSCVSLLRGFVNDRGYQLPEGTVGQTQAVGAQQGAAILMPPLWQSIWPEGSSWASHEWSAYEGQTIWWVQMTAHLVPYLLNKRSAVSHISQLLVIEVEGEWPLFLHRPHAMPWEMAHWHSKFGFSQDTKFHPPHPWRTNWTDMWGWCTTKSVPSLATSATNDSVRSFILNVTWLQYTWRRDHMVRDFLVSSDSQISTT